MLELLNEARTVTEEVGFIHPKRQKEKEEPITKLEHQFVPALEFCGWLPCSNKKEFDLKAEVQSCHPYCCFNHLVGMPRKEELDLETGEVIEGDQVELTEYERRVIENYEKDRKYAINKCRGAGITTLLPVRHMAYKYAILNTIPDRKCIVCAGNGLALSLDIMHRIKLVLDKIPFVYKKIPTTDKPQEITLRSQGLILALAAEVLSLAGLENVGDFIGDEITKWNLVDDSGVLKTALPYATKSFAHIVFFGTPWGQRGFAYERIFNPALEHTSGFSVQVLNWREVMGIPEEDMDIVRTLVDVSQTEIKQIYKIKHKNDEIYREWFHTFFGNDVTIDQILAIETPLLDLQEIIDMYDNERETYDQELDNQYIVPTDSLYGDHTKLYSTADFEPEDIGVPQG